MRISDELMWRYLTLLSFQEMTAIEKKKAQVAGGANPRDVKFDFAREIVERFHGRSAAEKAAAEFNARFREGQLPADIPEVSIAIGEADLVIAQVLKRADLVPSVSEANRLIEQGGVKIDGDKISDRGLRLARGKSYLAQVGKRKAAKVTLK
jgi:tyrosyl-tRNA synthetase